MISKHHIVSPVAMLIGLAVLVGSTWPGFVHASAAPAVPAATTYPAFVFTGRCASLDSSSPLALADAAVIAVYGKPTPADLAADLPLPLDELTASPYAIVARAGPEDTDVLACGDIQGMAARGVLAIGLQEQNHSGYVGIARLREDRNHTRLAAFLIEGLAGTASARKGAWAVAEAPGCGCATAHNPNATAVTVAMIDALFVPASFQLPAGATVTWVNDDLADHTVTIFRAGRLVADSDTLPTGRSFGFAFAAPGIYDYLSTADPAMRGRIVVSPSA
jgi:plastocyanin